jgi:hypothetical protein
MMEKVHFNVRKRLIMFVLVIILIKNVNLNLIMNVNVQMDKYVYHLLIISMVDVIVKKIILYVKNNFIVVYVIIIQI